MLFDGFFSPAGGATGPRRECLKCEKRFTTYERIEESLPHLVKKDGAREPFNREKIKQGIRIACRKRSVSTEDIEKAVERLELKFMEYGEKEVASAVVGEAVMKELKKLDEVAYVRFASVYREFRDINEFMSELKDLLGKEKGKKKAQSQKGKSAKKK